VASPSAIFACDSPLPPTNLKEECTNSKMNKYFLFLHGGQILFLKIISRESQTVVKEQKQFSFILQT
jgi:hypothetical protein